MKTIAIAITNQKGGVGKSSSAAAIGKAFSLYGKKVLLIDLDPQGNLSYIMAADTSKANILDVMQEPEQITAAIQKTEQGDIIASAKGLAIADQLFPEDHKEFILKKAIEKISGLYDYVIIDTPPALGIITINALTACSEAIIPAQADILSLQGIGQLSETIDRVRKYCNADLKIAGIVLTRYNGRAVISREIGEAMEHAAQQLKTKLFNTRVRECTAIKEAQLVKKDIFSYASRSNAAADYKALAAEILKDKGKE